MHTYALNKILSYKTVCDKCYGKTWYEKEQPCQKVFPKCSGKLRVIDYSDINQEFVPYLGTNTRVRVKFPWGEVKTGLIGMTSGWKPVLLLMARSTSIGSSDILSKDVRQSIDKVTRGTL